MLQLKTRDRIIAMWVKNWEEKDLSTSEFVLNMTSLYSKYDLEVVSALAKVNDNIQVA